MAEELSSWPDPDSVPAEPQTFSVTVRRSGRRATVWGTYTDPDSVEPREAGYYAESGQAAYYDAADNVGDALPVYEAEAADLDDAIATGAMVANSIVANLP